MNYPSKTKPNSTNKSASSVITAVFSILLSLLFTCGIFLPSAHAAAQTSAQAKDDLAKQAIYEGLKAQKQEFEVPYSPTLCSTLIRDVLSEHPGLSLYVVPVFQTVEDSQNHDSLIVQPTYDTSVLPVINQIIGSAPKNGSDYNKELYIHDTLINNITYERDNYSPHDIFIRKRCNCVGYSRAMAGLLEMLNVPCYAMSGKVKNGNHQWNIVILNRKPYVTDCCWDDRGNNKLPSHRYFNRTYKQMSEDHTANNSKDWSSCIYTDQGYYARSGLLVSNTADAARLLLTHPEVEMVSRIAAQTTLAAMSMIYLMTTNTALNVVAKY